MIRDTLRAALAAAVLWPMIDRPVPVPPPPPPLPAVAWQPAPPPAWPPPPGPVRRAAGAALDAADRLAARWLPPPWGNF